MAIDKLKAQHLPFFITGPGGTDYLLFGMAGLLVGFVLLAGVLLLRLHMLPEHIASKSKKIQLDIVAVLAMLAMFTHVNAFWVAALLLALIDFPDFGTPLRRVAAALERLAGQGVGLPHLPGKLPVKSILERYDFAATSAEKPASAEFDKPDTGPPL